MNKQGSFVLVATLAALFSLLLGLIWMTSDPGFFILRDTQEAS
jgi:hypothetical protein